MILRFDMLRVNYHRIMELINQLVKLFGMSTLMFTELFLMVSKYLEAFFKFLQHSDPTVLWLLAPKHPINSNR